MYGAVVAEDPESAKSEDSDLAKLSVFKSKEMVTTDEANELAAQWGPAFTSYGLGEKDGKWPAMFADKCVIVMPGEHQQAGLAGPKLMVYKEGIVDTATATEDGYVPVSLELMQEKRVAQLEAVNYAKTEAASKGVQGDQFILEYSRTNKDGDVYHVGYVLATVNSELLMSNLLIFS